MMNNAKSTFVTYMKGVIVQPIGSQNIVCLDSIPIYSFTEEQHNKDLQSVLDTLLKNQLLTKPSEYMF